LAEIAEAEARDLAGESFESPRRDLVPEDPQFEPPQPRMPSKQLIHLQRRQIIKNAPNAFKPKNNGEVIPELNASDLERAEALLREIESGEIPISLKRFAQMLNVKLDAMYNYSDICDRLTAHNKRHPTSATEMIEVQLQLLATSEQIVTPEEFARSCGLSTAAIYKLYPDWKQKLAEHKLRLQDEQIRLRAELHLQDLITSQTRETQQQFAKSIGIHTSVLVKRFSEIARKLQQHNDSIDAPSDYWKNYRENCIKTIYLHWNEAQHAGQDLTLVELAKKCSVEPDMVRKLCPELIPQLRKRGEFVSRNTEAALASAFPEIEESNKMVTSKEFASAAGIDENTLHIGHRQWQKRLDQHNNKVSLAKLQTAWDRMEDREEVWSLGRFASESEISVGKFHKYYADWVDRLKAYTISKTEEREHG